MKPAHDSTPYCKPRKPTAQTKACKRVCFSTDRKIRKQKINGNLLSNGVYTFFLDVKNFLAEIHELIDTKNGQSDLIKNPESYSDMFNRVNIAVIAGAGMEYSLSDKFYIRTEPIFRHSLPYYLLLTANFKLPEKV